MVQPAMKETQLSNMAKSHLFPHFFFMKEMREHGPKVITKGDGVYIWDEHGNKYLDAMSILWVVNAGHGRKEIINAMKEQLEKIEFVSLFGGYANEPSVKLAKKLSDITPGDLSVTFFVSGGSEAIESAIKLARQYHQLNGQPGRYKILSRREAYHGTTFGALSVSGIYANSAAFEPLLPGYFHYFPPYCYRCEYCLSYPVCNLLCVDTIERMIEAEGPKTISAIVTETVQSTLGSIVPPPDYFQKLRKLCDKYGILLIIDEVNNGFGRTGKMFAIERYGIVPDMMTFAKGITSGYAPLGAVIARQYIADKFSEWMFVHGITFGGHPASCAAALANIEIMEKEKLPDRSEEMGKYLLGKLNELRDLPLVGDVRGIGLHTTIEYVADKVTKKKIPTKQWIAGKVEGKMWEKGVYLCRASVDKTYIAPPLIIEREQIDEIVAALKESINEVAKELNGF